jgi:putative transposase
MNDPAVCALFLDTLEKTRRRFDLRVYGYVVMPEHVHLIISEPETGTLADAVHYLKLSLAKTKHPMSVLSNMGSFWQKRYYDRNIRGYSDFVEKLRYIHRNPVKRGLCAEPGDWPWSSFRHYLSGDKGLVEIESKWTAERREAAGMAPSAALPTECLPESGHPAPLRDVP